MSVNRDDFDRLYAKARRDYPLAHDQLLRDTIEGYLLYPDLYHSEFKKAKKEAEAKGEKLDLKAKKAPKGEDKILEGMFNVIPCDQVAELYPHLAHLKPGECTAIEE